MTVWHARWPIVSCSLLLCVALACKPKARLGSDPNAGRPQVAKHTTQAVENIQFEQLSLRGSGEFALDGEGTSFKYQINIECNKRIWARLSKVGIEGVRILATPDSLHVLDRQHRRYYCYTYAYVQQHFGIQASYQTLQDILLGNASYPDAEKQAPAAGYPASFAIRNNQYLLHYFVAADSRKVQRVEADSATVRISNLAYEKFMPTPAGNLAHQLLLQLFYPKTGSVLLTHEKVETNPEQITFSFNVPDSYERAQ